MFSTLNLFLTTSCTLQNFKNNGFHFNKQITEENNQFKKLKKPKGVNIPNPREEYTIPYQDEDLEKKNNDIFPPI